eukprot:CAMPEP_0172693798 /NCGR_PEP_ID=MMETSP1074-20121228/26254_1 /TAXON_ID=2916 /ORGANISM="Ceratium fusus, Strain PA161109" /LENGTH=82 /DNA_ID=CAMNT_0013514227 /DNA_START=9 /DNA_END=254 /DNA_ORIENTATION=-
MTLQEEQRRLSAECQRRQERPASIAEQHPGSAGASSSTTASVLRAPRIIPSVAPREQSDELVDMLKKAYETPASPKAMGSMG